MIAYVVQFHDAFGHHSVRKVAGSQVGAEAYITSALEAASATQIVWESNRTYCSAWGCIRGPQSGCELISYSIEAHEIID